MEIESAALIALTSIVIGWFSKGYAIGKKEQKIQDRLENIEKNQINNMSNIKVLDDKIELSFEKLKNHHDDDLKELRTFFVTPSGGQKFITFPDHDGMCERNSKATVNSITSLTEAIKENTNEVKKMNEEFHLIKVDVAVLKERRSAGMRSGDTRENE